MTDSQDFHRNMTQRILATTFDLLMEDGLTSAASVVANAVPSVQWIASEGDHNVWRLTLGLPATSFRALKDRNVIEQHIDAALDETFGNFPTDSMHVGIAVALEPENDDWRLIARQRLAGEGVTNQGRVRSDNVAARSHEGLLFRSEAETLFYDAMNRRNATDPDPIPFMPLPTVLAGRKLAGGRKRMEPDFVLFKDGVVMMVELDNTITHREAPHEAYARDAVLKDEGVLVERIETPRNANEARNAVNYIVGKIKKAKANR